MHHDSASFWADIKNYEERLAQDPDSYLFARLSEVYLKVHLIDDALHTARLGVAKYPTFIAGQLALAMACYAKGLHEESCQALEKVAAALPEDVAVQKLLGRLLIETGNLDAAQKAFRTALEFSPDDQECRDELKRMLQGVAEPLAASPQSPFVTTVDNTLDQSGSEILEEDDEIIELQESDIVEDLEIVAATAPEHLDPLSTATLAELYVQQGFISKALEIYRSVLAEDPSNCSLQSRISELEAIEAASSVDLSVPSSSTSFHTSSAQGEGDAVISTLEGWLDNIRRIKACH